MNQSKVPKTLYTMPLHGLVKNWQQAAFGPQAELWTCLPYTIRDNIASNKKGRREKTIRQTLPVYLR